MILPNNSFSINASRKTVKFKNYEKLQTKKINKLTVLENSFYIAQEYENNLREGNLVLQKEFEETLFIIRNFTNQL